MREETQGQGKTVYKKGKHPNSQAALNRNGRPKAYGAEKESIVLIVCQEEIYSPATILKLRQGLAKLEPQRQRQSPRSEAWCFTASAVTSALQGS